MKLNNIYLFVTLSITAVSFSDLNIHAVYPMSDELCATARGDGKCNSDSDCCCGQRCSSFGYCEI